MIVAALLAAATAFPLGVWPQDTGQAANVVQDVEFYLVEPQDDYSILAVEAIATPLKKADPAEVKRLAELARRLGADAVLLLGELAEKAIPNDPEAPLPTTGRYTIAVFLTFDRAEGFDNKPAVPGALVGRSAVRHQPGLLRATLHGRARLRTTDIASPR
ncbi:MAG: hypothetical protein ACHQQS_02580 [Thermoanaerobaculales bacterium]